MAPRARMQSTWLSDQESALVDSTTLDGPRVWTLVRRTLGAQATLVRWGSEAPRCTTLCADVRTVNWAAVSEHELNGKARTSMLVIYLIRSISR